MMLQFTFSSMFLLFKMQETWPEKLECLEGGLPGSLARYTRRVCSPAADAAGMTLPAASACRSKPCSTVSGTSLDRDLEQIAGKRLLLF